MFYSSTIKKEKIQIFVLLGTLCCKKMICFFTLVFFVAWYSNAQPSSQFKTIISLEQRVKTHSIFNSYPIAHYVMNSIQCQFTEVKN